MAQLPSALTFFGVASQNVSAPFIWLDQKNSVVHFVGTSWGRFPLTATTTSLLSHTTAVDTQAYISQKMSRSTLVSLFLLAITGTSTTDAFSPIVPSLRSTHCRTSSSSSTTARFVAIDTSDIKNGMTVELDNEPYKVLSFSIMKQARGAAKTTIKFKNLIRGTTIENTYRSGEKFETALIEKKAAQFTYKDEVSFFC